jgi:hypothetical protein
VRERTHPGRAPDHRQLVRRDEAGGGEPPRLAPPGGAAAPDSEPGVRRFGGRSMSMYPSFEVSAGAR